MRSSRLAQQPESPSTSRRRHKIAALEAIAPGVGVDPSIVVVTVLSFGTTLPELVVSPSAARAGKPYVAVGNILRLVRIQVPGCCGRGITGRAHSCFG
jgi:Sodium/calcium exchanger protein